jgi:hypothetical protein
MMTDESLAISVGFWTHVSGSTWRQLGIIDRWSSLSYDIRHLQPGPWSMSMAYESKLDALTKSCLVTFDARGQRYTGTVETRGYSSDETTGRPLLDLQGLDAMVILGDALVLPDPAAAVNAQTDAYYVDSGVGETVLSRVIAANVNRVYNGGTFLLALETDQGRGSSVTLHERFTNLLQLVSAKADIAGLGVRVGLVSPKPTSTTATLTCQFYTPRDQSKRVHLSHKAGTLRSWSQSDNAPTVTRPVVAGGGVGAARVMRQKVIATDVEAEWGRRKEVFLDARDTSDAATMDERAQSAINDGAEQSSFDLTSAEAVGMRWGDHFVTGDSVTIDLLTGVSKVDRLNSIVITADDSGRSVQPRPGNPDGSDPLFGQAAITRGLAKGLRGLQQEES